MWAHAAALAWWNQVQDGILWTCSKCVGEATERAMLGGIYGAREAADFAGRNPMLVVNMDDGGSNIWRIARELEKAVWDCHVWGVAASAGLIVTCACRGHRTCGERACFLFHSVDERHPEAEDQQRAEWFAARTTQPVEFWLELCEQGDTIFRAEEALAWGVVHEIIETGA